MHHKELDGILASLACPQMADHMDRLLDLRETVAQSDHAGTSVRIYYELVAEKPSSGVVDRQLAALREWIEKNIMIEVLDDSQSMPFESLPMKYLEAPDLESCCHAAMQHISQDRCFPSPSITLRFAFAG